MPQEDFAATINQYWINVFYCERCFMKVEQGLCDYHKEERLRIKSRASAADFEAEYKEAKEQ